jgi:hypothetical protein
LRLFSSRFQAAFFLREALHMQAGQCDSQRGIKFWEVVSDEHGIGGGGDYYGDRDAQLNCANALYHEARPKRSHPWSRGRANYLTETPNTSEIAARSIQNNSKHPENRRRRGLKHYYSSVTSKQGSVFAGYALRMAGGKCVSRAVLFDLEPGVIGAIALSRCSASFSPGHPREPKRARG